MQLSNLSNCQFSQILFFSNYVSISIFPSHDLSTLQFPIFVFSSERKNYFENKKTNPPLPPQFSLNFHFNFPSTLPAPLVKSVGKSNDDKTIRESTAESGYLIMIRTLFKTIVSSERIKVWPDRLFPSHPVCTRLSVKLLIGVHASPREGREGREEATLTVILEDFLPSGGV